ncbi:zinc ribbon domain-containing protein [Natrinema amylolyticum]|uniref:zinc ribbon domain-containing protein n=1 Tax=Natrinema amylolyticum TaxID=2878679 RepID=UPI001CFBD883|nr:zinc ribbon domain-containing protein [Natrinema amylolyticum]
MTLIFVGAILSLCLLPSVCFLGFWYGLVRMQRSSLIARTSDRAGHTDPAVTWGDVIDAYADPQKRLFGPPSDSQTPATRADQCSACAADNDSVASFCQNCFRKLE